MKILSPNFVSFCIKQAKISANGVRKIIIIQRLNKIIFTKFGDNIFIKKSFYLSSKCIRIQQFLDIYTRKDLNTKQKIFFAY